MASKRPELTPEQLKAEIEEGCCLPVGLGTEAYLAVTGEPYVSFLGWRRDEDEIGLWCNDPGEAARILISQVALYTVLKVGIEGTLYWRTMPELHTRQMTNELGETETLFSYWARLLASKTAPLNEQAA